MSNPEQGPRCHPSPTARFTCVCVCVCVRGLFAKVDKSAARQILMWVYCCWVQVVTCEQDAVHQSAAVAVSVACLSCLRLIKCGSLGPVRVQSVGQPAAAPRGWARAYPWQEPAAFGSCRMYYMWSRQINMILDVFLFVQHISKSESSNHIKY